MIILIKFVFWFTITFVIGLFGAEDWALRKWREKRERLNAQFRKRERGW
jgi:hypothetical protein